MKKTLLIMAAGLGSRYGGGGHKQVDHMGPNGEILMEYSIYDAMEAGFDKVVFVIKRSMETSFRAQVGDKIARKVEVHYAFQEYDSLPEGFTPPAERTKPYGTVHAVLCARDVIAEPFAVINADDYYGKDAFQAMSASLDELATEAAHASMMAYYLSNTVSKNGDVTRGICEKDGSNHLVKVTETYGIKPCADGTIRSFEGSEEGIVLNHSALVSMNFWGLHALVLRQGGGGAAGVSSGPWRSLEKGISPAPAGGCADARGRTEGGRAVHPCGMVRRDQSRGQSSGAGGASQAARVGRISCGAVKRQKRYRQKQRKSLDKPPESSILKGGNQ